MVVGNYGAQTRHTSTLKSSNVLTDCSIVLIKSLVIHLYRPSSTFTSLQPVPTLAATMAGVFFDVLTSMFFVVGLLSTAAVGAAGDTTTISTPVSSAVGVQKTAADDPNKEEVSKYELFRSVLRLVFLCGANSRTVFNRQATGWGWECGRVFPFR